MDASTTEPVFRTDPESGNLILRRKSEAMVKNVTVITDLILNWRIWEGAEEGVHVLLFLALALLVREDHRYQRFNVIQFQSINLISKIFCNYQVGVFQILFYCVKHLFVVAKTGHIMVRHCLPVYLL